MNVSDDDLKAVGVDRAGRLYLPESAVKFEAGQAMLRQELERRAAARRPKAVRKSRVVPDEPMRNAQGVVVGVLRADKFLPTAQPDAKVKDPAQLLILYDAKGRPVGTAPAKALTKVKQATQPAGPVTKQRGAVDPLEALREYARRQATARSRPAPPLPPGAAGALFRKLRAVDPALGR